MAQEAVVPGYAPIGLLLALQTLAILISAWIALQRRSGPAHALALCSRCSRLHKRTEALGAIADAVAVGAFGFLVALPFLAAGYEDGFSFAPALLAVSAIGAALTVAALAGWCARIAAAQLWPRFTWSVAPSRILGSGARWLGIVPALYLFDKGDRAIVTVFGQVGQRLVVDLASTATIRTAAALLIIGTVVAVAARWLIPLVFLSRPATFALRRSPHGTAA